MVHIVIPFRPSNPKSRLADYLSEGERQRLAVCMLKDVLSAVRDYPTSVLASELPADLRDEIEPFADLIVDPRPLDEAVNAVLQPETAVIMSDLPLINRKIVKGFVETEGDVVIAPGRKGGTNMLLVRIPFRVSYHYGSFLKHVKMAKKAGAKVSVYDSFFASVDIDTYDDLLEVMLHGRGETKRFLSELGFRIVMEKEPRLIREV
ncbi:2-phospho-L-lactate guanylyltransferase [Archaeoglobus veneficus]|uniref:2-phospho-L-lactate guanylyltransferase n=1 Tax=Archaeoglobus veneficus (strain DSM 11195 / SNP6) TaxID=693661 RepID=F2KQ16_ARCVS|nr:2-phospho-L-lactate guanylyltransferase [Archaeoglobus veneficus]AEA47619.1 2-phospho-L-lactate guanylyltransferase CofC [Archaeoglobus veneficus SNP6]